MNDPCRLREGADDFERALLQSARADAPTHDARARQLAVLGVAGATAGATPGAVGAFAALSKAGVVKWALVVLLVGSAAAGARLVVDRREPASLVAAAPTPAVSEREAETRVAPTATATAPADTVSAAPPSRVVRGAPPRSAPLPVAAPPASSTPIGLPPARLAEETAALDSARTALRSGSTVDALRALDAHARDYPGGALQPEASALRVEALLATGDRAGAETVARALLATYPATPSARRVRAMLNW